MSLTLPPSTRSVLVVAMLCFPPLAAGQTGGDTPRTPWGDPDLQSVWDFRTFTPLERPAELAGKATLTEEEAAEIEATAPAVVSEFIASAGGDVGGYNDFWFDIGTNVVESLQTSLIIDPPDGRLPALVSDALRQVGSGAYDIPGERPVRYRVGGIGVDGPEDRGLSERCLVGFNAGPPMMPSAYNNNMQIFQTLDHVVILNEMVHDVRIVPLDGRQHLDGIRQWMGDARGHWEGETLVVDTLNFTEKRASFDPFGGVISLGTGEHVRLTERFTRIDRDTLHYEYTVTDPTTFVRPFTVLLPMRRLEQPIFEYACHEGNYGLANMLRGARRPPAQSVAGSRSQVR